MFEQTFKNIDDILHKDAGCTSELDYTEQSSWLLFLKYLDALEADRAAEAELEGRAYSFILAEPFRWERWAAPKNAEGRLDHHTALTGDDLRDFVNTSLFPYLAGFKQRASGPNTIEYKIGEVFGEIKNKIQSGYNLRDVIDLVDELRFRSQTEKHELSHLYEAKIKNMGNAGRNGGEYYTPRPLDPAYLSYVLRSPAFLEAAIGGLDREVLLDLLALLSAEGRVGEDDEAPNIVHTNTLGENQMISKDFQRRVREGAGQATLPIINKSKWSALTVLVPQAPEDQNRIVEELDTLQANLMSLEDVYQRKLADLEELKQSLLHQAFSGQL